MTRDTRCIGLGRRDACTGADVASRTDRRRSQHVDCRQAFRLLRTITATAVEDRLIRGIPARSRGQRSSGVRSVRHCGRGGLHGGGRDAGALALPTAAGHLLFAALGRACGADPARRHGGGRRGPRPRPRAESTSATPWWARCCRPCTTTCGRSSLTSTVFAGPKGALLWPSNFQPHWCKALVAASLDGVHFHDLRHTGNTLTAQAGATLPELMARMGHACPQAALVYPHTISTRDRAVATTLDVLVQWGRARSGHAGGQTREEVRQTPEERRSPRSLEAVTWGFGLERVTRIELALSAWEADVLPLNYTRVRTCWVRG